jgi:hypothetical protein
MPGHPDFALLVAGFEEPEELRLALVVEAFVALGEQASRSVEGVVSVTACPRVSCWTRRRTVIELGVGQLDHVERVGDLDRVRHRVVEGLAVGPGQIQRGEGDAVSPGLGARVDPRRGALGGAALHDIEQLRRATRRRPATPPDIDSTGAGTGKPTPRSTASCSCDSSGTNPTKEYAQRRTAEGKTKTEIIRCLKRYVARELYPLLPLAPVGGA